MSGAHGQAESALDVQVDRTKCCASGMCAALAPDAFAIDPQGFSVVLDGAPGMSLDLLVHAAKSCPTMCISLHQDGAEIDLFS